ncbi:MAG: alpha/beta hydrolase [Myxococcota bacterium]
MPTGWSPWADWGVHGGLRLQRHVRHGVSRVLGPNGVRFRGDFRSAEAEFRAMQAAVPLTSDHAVILLHGLFRSRGAMGRMARALAEDGYAPATVHYPSTRRDIDGHAEQVEGVLDRIVGPTQVSFVGHSLGGIVARRVLDRTRPWRDHLTPRRLVTLGSPHQGAAIAEALHRVPGFRRFAGPTLTELTPANAKPQPPPVPFAVIAGGRRGTGFNPLLEGDDDMTVRVDEAMLEGADDTLVLDAVHTLIMMDRRAIDAVRHYLSTGRLSPAATETSSSAADELRH